jgi:hypothetical protein
VAIRWGWVSVVSLVVIGLVGAISGKEGSNPPKPAAPEVAKDPELEALGSAAFVCQSLVPDFMNDPDSVEFVNPDLWFRKRLSETEFQVIMQVRARNAFNALVLGEIDCRVERVPEGWRVVSATQL